MNQVCHSICSGRINACVLRSNLRQWQALVLGSFDLACNGVEFSDSEHGGQSLRLGNKAES
jgi:hypothetical protein